MRWGTRTLGEYGWIQPVEDWMPVHPFQLTAISWSLKGSGTAARARMKLREVPPRKLGPAITMARRIEGRPKTWFLPRQPGVNNRDPKTWPDWYRSRTKGQLFIEQSLTEEQRLLILKYMTLENFWRAATGRVHPEEVINLVRHQPSLLSDWEN